VIEAIREAIDFPTLVEETTGGLPHHPDGRPAMGLCPFHDDRKTPSLAVYGDHAHCFGACNQGWDVFSWVMQRDHLDFHGALALLAKRAGVTLHPLSPEEAQAAWERREYEDALTLAACHFTARLQEAPQALEYAHRRAWSDEAIRAEGVGYVDGGPLPALGNSQAQAVTEALNRWAARVGGAIVYAHRDGGRVVYLAGRSLQGKEHHNPPGDLAGPRRPYLNALYSSRASELVVVEGQGCAIVLGGWGFPTLALAGSGLTGDRSTDSGQSLACRLKRHVERGATVYLIPDGDGKTDVEALAAAVGPLLRIVALPDGVADANALAQGGATAEDLRALLERATTWLDLRIEAAAQAQGVARDRAIEGLFPLLAGLPPVTAARYRGRVLKALPEIRSRDYGRLLKAAQRSEEDLPAAAEVLEGSYPVISPALDFLDGLAVVTVPFMVRSGGSVGYQPYLVTSGRELIPLNGERFITIGGRSVVLRDTPAALPGSARWAWSDVQAYLMGDTPSPIDAYLETEWLLDRYLDFRDGGTSDVLALWVMGSYLYPLFEAFPYLALQGPKGSGKTKTLDVLAKLSFNARVSSSLSPASLFRVVQATRGMLGVDEAERLGDPKDPMAGDLRLLLNAGYKRGAPAIRCEGDEHQVIEFEVYGPKAVASIRGLEDVLESRCIRITMLRTAGPKGNLVVSESGQDWSKARHMLYCFALQHFAGVRDAYLRGAGADGLSNRQAELWRPLLAIAAYLDGQGAEGLLKLAQDYARQKAGQAEEDGLDDWRRALLLALYRLADDSKNEVMPKEVREAMADFMEGEEYTEVKPSWVGYRLKEFGFRRKRVKRGSVYLITRETALDVIQRYGLEVPTGSSDGGNRIAIKTGDHP
jgi:hypothetical protein